MELNQNVLHFGTVGTGKSILCFSGLPRLPLNFTAPLRDWWWLVTTKAPNIMKKASTIRVFEPNVIMEKSSNIRVFEPNMIEKVPNITVYKPNVMEKAPNIMVLEPNLMVKASNIMVFKPNIKEKALNITVFEPNIMSFAPHIMKRALNIKTEAQSIMEYLPYIIQKNYHRAVLAFHTMFRVSTTKRPPLTSDQLFIHPVCLVTFQWGIKISKYRVNLVFKKQLQRAIDRCSLDVLTAHIMELTWFFGFSFGVEHVWSAVAISACLQLSKCQICIFCPPNNSRLYASRIKD